MQGETEPGHLCLFHFPGSPMKKRRNGVEFFLTVIERQKCRQLTLETKTVAARKEKGTKHVGK